MAFTPFERQLAAQYFAQYGGKLPGGEYSETAIQDFMLADEAGRRTLLKDMLTNLVIPTLRDREQSLQESRVDVLQRIAGFSAYVSVYGNL